MQLNSSVAAVITGGASALQPGQGFKDIYTSRTQFSLFGAVKFTF